MSKRLRLEDISVKPTIYMDGDSFRVEYYGPITKGHCGVGFPTFEAAIAHGNSVARRNPRMVQAINAEQERARLVRRLAKQGFGIAA